MINDPRHQGIAEQAQAVTTDHLKLLVEMTEPGYRSASLTGALYAVVRIMCAMKPGDLPADTFRASMLSSFHSAMSQALPDSPFAGPAAGDPEAARIEYLALIADSACRAVQGLADILHTRGVGGPMCPMDGIVSGLISGAVYVAGAHRDRDEYADAASIGPVIMALVTETLSSLALHEAGEAMGEVQGHG